MALSATVVGFGALVTAFAPMFFGPGLTNVEPIGEFLNGNFPDYNVVTDPYEVAFGNLTFNDPLTFTVVPNQGRIVIGQRNGEVFWIAEDDATAVKNPLIDLSAEVGVVWDGGFLGLSIHPEFGATGKNYFYIYYTTASDDDALEGGHIPFFCGVELFHGNYLVLERFEVNPATMEVVPNSRETMIKRRMYNTTHRGGGMEFGDDGFLYLSTGDQGTLISAQQLDENLDGGVLRIDVDMDAAISHAPIRTMPDDAGEADEITGQYYFIPNDNPFPSPMGTNFEEYYTLGHRNPHRMTKDSQTGIFYMGEVGEITHEEINVVSKGKNYGWPVFEANIPGPQFQCGIGLLNDMDHEGPLTEFSRADAGSIIGGYVYRGNSSISFNGKYIAADWLTMKIFSVDISNGSFETLGTLPRRPISFGQDSNGELYYLTQGDNVQLLRFKEPGIVSGMPPTLTATGAFTDLENLTVADGFVPYEMIDPFWSDGATKKRWLAVPNTNGTPEPIQFSEDGVWIFPVGSVIIKHFDYPVDDADPSVSRKIETRFSIKNSNGNWTYLSYNWNEAQTEAFLVDMSTGEDEPITVSTSGGGTRTVTWRYPSTNECLNCHNAVSQGTLGPRTRYLNSDYNYAAHDPSGSVGNQLVTLSHLGILDQTITDQDTPNFLTHTSMDNTSASLDDKARSYLDLNCAYCHQPGTDIRADFDLRLANSLIETGLLTAGINNPLPGMPVDQKILFAGDSGKSQIFHRANILGPGMMPPVAKGQVDDAGVALLQQWINQLLIPPTPVATADVTLGGAPLSVQFTGSGSTDDLGIASYAWDFGDGGTSTDADPTYVYTTPGQYTANLTVTDTDGQTGVATIENIVVTGGALDNVANADVNLALLPDAFLNGSVEDGRGTPQSILFDPATNDYVQQTAFNEYGVTFGTNLGTPDADNGFNWQVDWVSRKQVNYITFGGVYPNQAQPNSLWRISYRVGNDWTVLDEGVGGWLNAGIFEWNGRTEPPIEMDALRIQVYSDGVNDLVNIHLRGRGGISSSINDSATEPKATLIQFLPNDGSPVSAFDFTANDLEVTFDSSPSSDDIGIVSYAWDFGDGNSSTEANPVHTYAEAGTYEVSLTVTDADDLNDVSTQNISVTGVSAIPIALASADVTSGTAPVLVSFIGSGSTDDVAITGYAWDFGDGGSSTEADPSHTYTAPGQYTAMLTVTDGDDNTANTTVQIVVSGGAVDNEPNAQINLALLPDALVSGTISDGRGTPQAILYDPSTNNYFEPTPFNEYGVAFGENLGTPSVDEGFQWQVDWVAPKEVNYITFGGVFQNQPQPNSLWRISYREGNEWTILDEGVGGWLNAGIFEWGGQTQAPIQMEGLRVQVYSDGTTDLVSIHLRGRGGVSLSLDDSDTLTKATLIQYLPETGAPVAQFDQVINDLEVTFDSSESMDNEGIVSYTWDFGDGNGSTVPNPVHTYAQPGTYTVTLTVTDEEGLSDVQVRDITVTGDITVPVARVSADVVVGPAPLSVSYTGNGSTDDVGIASYGWTFGDGGTSTEIDPTHLFTVPGRYTTTLTVTDDDGLFSSDTIEIIVTGGTVDNVPNAGINLALLPDAFVDGSTDAGRGTPQSILYDPATEAYFQQTNFNEYGVLFGANLGTPGADDGFRWQVDWVSRKQVNYITFGGVFPNQPQPNSLWRISYRTGTIWNLLEEGVGGWIDAGIYEWGGPTEAPIAMDALRVQVFSDGINDLVSIHLRGRGGVSNSVDDSATTPKATVIQYLPDTGAPESVFDFTLDVLELTLDSSGSTDDVGIAAYAWDFGDGNSSTDPNPVHTFAEPGTYTVSLTVTDTDGQQDTSAAIVEVVVSENQPPVAVITTSLITGEAPLTENFTGSGSTDDVAVVSYFWDFGDGNTSTDADPTYIYDTPGNYTATLTVADEEGLTDQTSVLIVVTSGGIANAPNAGINLALVPDAVLTGSVTNGRGTPQSILYDPARNDYFVRTNYNEYGVPFGQNLGTPDADNGFRWQVDWIARKQVNYITFGGAFENQPQPNSQWRISYRIGNEWTVLDEGVGGWINAGIYEWGGGLQEPIAMDGLRVQVFSDGVNDLVSVHLRGRGGRSNLLDDRATTPKATLIQYLPDAGAPNSDFTFTATDLEVVFDSSNSTDDLGIVSYLWDFGDGNTATDANPTHLYFQSGTYTVSLTVTDADGKQDTSSQSLTVTGNGTPIAVASADVLTGDAPLTVQFTGASSQDDVAVTEYSWDFGDGGSADVPNPQYIFENVGSYTVLLTVRDAEGLSGETSLIITANTPNEAPVAVATSDISTGDAPLSVQFTGSGSTDDVEISSYAWDFGDGGSATEANPLYGFTTAGVYTVILTVTDAEGLTDEASLTITVTEGNEAPVAVATSDVSTGNAPLTVQFTGSGSTDDVEITSYAWDFGDGGSATEANPSYEFTTAGVYAVILTVTDAEGLTDEASLTITVTEGNEAPVAVATSDVSTGNAPLTVQFTGSGSTDDVEIVSYAWDFGDGGSATEVDPSYEFTTPGTYEVTLTVTDGEGLSGETALTITVNTGNTAPNVVATADVLSGNAPFIVDFSSSGTTDDSGIASFAWDFGDGGSSADPNPSYEFTSPGTYTVTLTVTDDEGLSGTATLEIEVMENLETLEDLELILTPNPSVDFVDIILNGAVSAEEIVGFTLHDTAGRLIAQYMPSAIFLSENNYRIPLDLLMGEVYVVTIILNNQEPISKRLIVRK